MELQQLSGLASGFDWLSVVDRLTTINRIPQNRLRSDKTVLSSQLTALEDLETKLQELEDATDALGEFGLFFGRLASLADPDSTVLAGTAAAETQIGSYQFVISQLATQTSRGGSSDVGSPISSTSDVSGVTLSTMNLATPITAGTFTVNGQQVTVDTADSLQDVFDAIDTATSSSVTASYDPVQDRITLSSTSEIILGGPNDTSNFLSATRLFSNGAATVSSASSLGVVNQNTALISSGLRTPITNVDGSGNGTFTINGVDITFNVNVDSVRDIIERVNGSTAGVNLTFDSATDSFKLINKETGSLGLSVSETVGGFLEAVGLNSTSTLNLGDNSEYTVNGGGTLISNSNVLDVTSHGIEGLKVTAEATGTETVEVSTENTDARAKIEEFIEKFNAVESFIADKTKITVENDEDVTTSVLTKNREVRNLASSLRSLAFATVSGLSGTVKRLQDIGIDFKTSSDELEIVDGTALDDALAENPDAVAALFTDATEGLSKTFDDFIENFSGVGGTLETQTDNINSQSKKIDDQIEVLERRIETDRQSLIDSFVRMEEAQARLQQQLDALNRNLLSF